MRDIVPNLALVIFFGFSDFSRLFDSMVNSKKMNSRQPGKNDRKM